MKKRSNHPGETGFLTPEMAARKIRSGYFTYFLPPIVNVGSAIFFAIEHEWVTCAAFIGCALIYMPIALSQYRFDKMICEQAILKYRQWHAQEQGSPNTEPL